MLFNFHLISGELNWKVKDVGSVATFDESYALDLNDQGQLLVKGILKDKFNRQTTIYGIGSVNSGLIILPQYNPSKYSDHEVFWLKLNKSVAIGIRNIRAGYEFFPELITWNAHQGIKTYNFPPNIKTPYYLVSGHSSDPLTIAQCYNSKYIALTCEDKIFVLKNEDLIDTSVQLNSKVKELGIHFNDIKWKAIAINDNGQIYGKFDVYEKHPQKDKSILIGEKYFLTDCERLILIDVPEKVIMESRDRLCHLNNKNEILFLWYEPTGGKRSWIWNESLGFRELTLFNSQGGCKGFAIAKLDDDTLIFAISNPHDYDFIFVKNDEENLINIFQSYHTDNIDVTQYPTLHSYGLKLDLCLLNNKKQTVFLGKYFDEIHPFLLNLE